MMYYGDGYQGNWAWMIASMIAMALFWVAVIWAIARAVTSYGAKRETPSPPDASDPLAMLKRRYAAGELDDAEYQHRRAILTDTP